MCGTAVASHEIGKRNAADPLNARDSDTTDLSHITAILDRTGSMLDIRDDVIGGFNAFLVEQQSASAIAALTLVSSTPVQAMGSFIRLGRLETSQRRR